MRAEHVNNLWAGLLSSLEAKLLQAQMTPCDVNLTCWGAVKEAAGCRDNG